MFYDVRNIRNAYIPNEAMIYDLPPNLNADLAKIQLPMIPPALQNIKGNDCVYVV